VQHFKTRLALLHMRISRHISRMFLSCVLAAMMLGLAGGHWAILQTVAWTKMIVVYSRASSVRTAITQTFDGQHPCKMCKLIQKAKQSSKQQELQQPSSRHDTAFFEACAFTFPNPPCSWIAPIADFAFPSRNDPPPVPPPRRRYLPAYS
jgi:hypothetical protein